MLPMVMDNYSYYDFDLPFLYIWVHQAKFLANAVLMDKREELSICPCNTETLNVQNNLNNVASGKFHTYILGFLHL